MLFKQQSFCFKRCWHAPDLDSVDKALVSRQSWSWTTLPRKPVYVKATKFTSCPFSFLFLSCESEADSRFMLQDSFSTLTEHSEGVYSATRAPISLFRGYVCLWNWGLNSPWNSHDVACLSVCGIKNSSNKLFILQWLVSVASWSPLNFHSPKGEWRDFNTGEKLCKIFCWSLEWT